MRMLIITAILLCIGASADAQSKVPLPPIWCPDNGDGTFTNPVVHADYSDPDVIRVGDDFYMTASSFSNFPGLPILHSRDLVNWTIIGHALPEYPIPEFSAPQHGMAVWAPALRFHNGEFFIYFGDPDRGVFVTKAGNPAGPWEPLRLVRKVTGWIDPCPFWDDDGNAYLVHAFANSRVGIKSILAVNRMSPDGMKILDDGVVVFVGHSSQPTIEGPKFYKRNGCYYIFAPAGGVKPGWQTVLRSKNVFGPYEDKIVLEQGSTRVNGPHQGAWVDTKQGEDWFMHFQDRYAYGRIVHLQPMRWENDWPVIGADLDKNGVGEPVSKFRKPNVQHSAEAAVPQTSDEFDEPHPGLQWQWEANPQPAWYSLTDHKGHLRLFAQTVKGTGNLWNAGNLVGQKFPAPAFVATTRVIASGLADGDRCGVAVYGLDYACLSVVREKTGYRVEESICRKADKNAVEEVVSFVKLETDAVQLRVAVRPASDTAVVPVVLCTFSYSTDGRTFIPFGKEFVAREGLWVGGRIAIFAQSATPSERGSYADVDWFRMTK